jgi:hypothetical protein
MTDRTEIETSRIVESEAFRAINLLLDQKSEQLAQSIVGLRGRIDQCYSKTPGVPTDFQLRVSAEPEKKVIKLAADPVMLISDLRVALEGLSQVYQEITSLKRFKLRLLNDYDFTHGDDTEQRQVFLPEADGRIGERPE